MILPKVNVSHQIDYQTEANVRLEFYDLQNIPKNPSGQKPISGPSGKDQQQSSKTEDTSVNSSFSLYGFLGPDGLSLRLANRYNNSIEFAGSIFQQLQEFAVGGKMIGELAAHVIPGAAGILNKLRIATTTNGYVPSGFGGGKSIVLNAPFYWQGTDPIRFDLSLYQVAMEENEIIRSYQEVLRWNSPTMDYEKGTPGGPSTQGSTRDLTFKGLGPAIVIVHYFPVTQSGKLDARNGQGRLIFGPCLCHSVSAEINAPYTKSYYPLMGIYKFELSTSRIVDRNSIDLIFQATEISQAIVLNKIESGTFFTTGLL